jgi:hypothetical protein
MAAMVARLRRQSTPKAIAVARGGYRGSRRTARTRRSWECGKLGEDGTTVTNFAVERHDNAPAEKREREECRRLELKTCSPTPGCLRSVALRPPTAVRSNSEPCRPAARHSNAPHQLSHAPPSAARLWSHCTTLTAARHPPTPLALLKVVQEPLLPVFHTRQVPPSAR